MSINSVAIIILSQPKPLQFRTSTSINNFKGYMSFLAEGHFKENPEILHQIIYEICAILSLFLAKTKKKKIFPKKISKTTVSQFIFHILRENILENILIYINIFTFHQKV